MSKRLFVVAFLLPLLLAGAAAAQTVADLKGNWLTREPAASGGSFVTLYTITPAAETITLRSAGVRLEDSPFDASAGSGTDYLFEVVAAGRDLSGTLLFRQSLRGLCEMPDLRILVRGTISPDWNAVELQYDFPREEYDPCGWNKSMTTPAVVQFRRDK